MVSPPALTRWLLRGLFWKDSDNEKGGLAIFGKSMTFVVVSQSINCWFSRKAVLYENCQFIALCSSCRLAYRYTFSVHSSASFSDSNTSTLVPSRSAHKPTPCNAVPTSPSDFAPHIINRTSLAASKRCTLTNASAEEKSRPWTRAKSMMRKRIGLCCHLARSRSFRISSSTVVIVPKNTTN